MFLKSNVPPPNKSNRAYFLKTPVVPTVFKIMNMNHIERSFHTFIRFSSLGIKKKRYIRFLHVAPELNEIGNFGNDALQCIFDTLQTLKEAILAAFSSANGGR